VSRRSSQSQEEIEMPPPRETTAFVGHVDAEAELLAAYRSGRMPHAWLIGGPRGIGKATLAYRTARFIFCHPDPADPAVQNAWRRAAGNISTMTANYLSPAELAGVWQTIRATPCYRNANGLHRLWADFLAAVAARDATQIVTLGSALQQAAPLSQDERTYVTTMMATAYLREGMAPQARGLLETQWGRLDHAGEFGFALRDLSALVRSERPLATAQALGARPGVD